MLLEILNAAVMYLPPALLCFCSLGMSYFLYKENRDLSGKPSYLSKDDEDLLHKIRFYASCILIGNIVVGLEMYTSGIGFNVEFTQIGIIDMNINVLSHIWNNCFLYLAYASAVGLLFYVLQFFIKFAVGLFTCPSTIAFKSDEHAKKHAVESESSFKRFCYILHHRDILKTLSVCFSLFLLVFAFSGYSDFVNSKHKLETADITFRQEEGFKMLTWCDVNGIQATNDELLCDGDVLVKHDLNIFNGDKDVSLFFVWNDSLTKTSILLRHDADRESLIEADRDRWLITPVDSILRFIERTPIK